MHFFRRKPFSLSIQEINTWYDTYSDSPFFALSPPMLIASFVAKNKILSWMTIEWPRENLSLSIGILFPIREQTGLLRCVERRLLYLLMSSDFFAVLIRDGKTEKRCFLAVFYLKSAASRARRDELSWNFHGELVSSSLTEDLAGVRVLHVDFGLTHEVAITFLDFTF